MTAAPTVQLNCRDGSDVPSFHLAIGKWVSYVSSRVSRRHVTFFLPLGTALNVNGSSSRQVLRYPARDYPHPSPLKMSVDPYHQVQSEIQGSLLAAEQLRASFLRIRSTARDGNEELEWARNEVRVVLVLVLCQNRAHRLLLSPH
jgi:hypothetical protein